MKTISCLAGDSSGDHPFQLECPCKGWLAFLQVTALLTVAACSVTLQAEDRPAAARKGFTVVERADRLVISLDGSHITEFVFHDELIQRPYFTQVRTTTGRQVTRQHPPVPGVDATDHDTMHPGIWLGFGDLSGRDFWRNKASIVHVGFTSPPDVSADRLQFATESKLVSSEGEGQQLGTMHSSFLLRRFESDWMLIWKSEFHPADKPLLFGDQEEMGFGTRVATAITEKNGGRILNSSGQSSAADTWGQSAQWCDYTGSINGQQAGITLMAAADNFRESWWHNRDYGLMVANPFGRQAMKQGERSVITVSVEKPLTLTFAACIHASPSYAPASAYLEFVNSLKIDFK